MDSLVICARLALIATLLSCSVTAQHVDTIQPTLLNFSMDLDTGAMELTFSEMIVVRSVSGYVQLQNHPITPSSVYTLTRNGTVQIQMEVVTIIIDNRDLNNLKLNENIASSPDNTFLYLLEMLAEDMSGNLLKAQETAKEAVSFIADTSGPAVVLFDLDLDSDILFLQFDEPVLVATFNQMGIGLTNTASDDKNTFKEVVQLTSVEIIAESTAILTSFRVLLRMNDSIQVKSVPICYSELDCFATFEAGLISDIFSNPSVAANSSLSVNNILFDVTPPRLVAFTQFDLDAGLFTLVFSEPVNSSGTDFTDVQFLNRLDSATVSVTLSEGFVTPDNIEIDFRMTQSDLNMVKISQMLCTEVMNCWIQLYSFFINDIAMNPFLHSNFLPNAQASFHQPLSFIPDTTPPVIRNFFVDMNLGKLTLPFSEVVLLNSFSPESVTFLGPREESNTLTLSNQSTFTRLTGGSDIGVQLTVFDLNSLKAQDFFTRTNDSFLVLAEGVLDTSNNVFQSISPSNAVQAALYETDSTLPILISFERFDRELGSLVLFFNEPVDINSVQIDNLYILAAPNSTSEYRLTGGEIMYVDESKLSMSVVLSKQDRTLLKIITDLARDEESVFVSILEGFVEDTSGNPCEGINHTHPLKLRKGQFRGDTVQASLMSYTLDLNIGLLHLTFDDVLNATSIDATKLKIQNSTSVHDSNVTYILTSQTNVLSTNLDIVTLALSKEDVDALKLNLMLARDASSTFISFESSFAADIEGKLVMGVSMEGAAMVNSFVPDSTRPQFLSFDLDMDTGLMNMSFTEPILVVTAITREMVFHNDEPLQEQYMMYGLTNSSILTTSATSFSILISIGYDDLNQLKEMSNLATERMNTFVSVSELFLVDTSENYIAESSVMVSTFVVDSTPPEVVYFDMQLTSPAALQVHFSEAVSIGSNTSRSFTLQNDLSSPSISLALTSIDTITQPKLDELEITLRLSYTTRLLTDDGIGSSVDSLFLSLVPEDLMDHNNNDVIPVLTSNALKVRLLTQLCFDTATFSDIASGTCQSCPIECVNSCTGSMPRAGEGGCDVCSVILLNQNGQQERCAPPTNTCPVGYFNSSGHPFVSSLGENVCTACHEDCAICTGASQRDCRGCTSAFIISQPSATITQCVSSCSGTANNMQCQFCHVQCSGCTGSTNTDCIQCRGDNMLVQGSDATRCVPHCDSDREYLIEGPPGEYTCQSCHEECVGCTGRTQAECLQCTHVNNTLIRGGVCSVLCPDETYLTQLNQCVSCHSQCIGCVGPTSKNCSQCKENSADLGNGITDCVPFCPFGMEFNINEQRCVFTSTSIIVMAVCIALACLLVVIAMATTIGLFHRHRKNKKKIPFAKRKSSTVVLLKTIDNSADNHQSHNF